MTGSSRIMGDRISKKLQGFIHANHVGQSPISSVQQIGTRW